MGFEVAEDGVARSSVRPGRTIARLSKFRRGSRAVPQPLFPVGGPSPNFVCAQRVSAKRATQQICRPPRYTACPPCVATCPDEQKLEAKEPRWQPTTGSDKTKNGVRQTARSRQQRTTVNKGQTRTRENKQTDEKKTTIIRKTDKKQRDANIKRRTTASSK